VLECTLNAMHVPRDTQRVRCTAESTMCSMGLFVVQLLQIQGGQAKTSGCPGDPLLSD
jgi:hypothetical protein